MKCPNCQTENNAAAKFCTSCGAPLAQAGGAGSAEAVKTAASAWLVFGKKARQLRLNTPVDPDAIISDRAYNGTIAVESELGKGTTFTLRIPLNRRRR